MIRAEGDHGERNVPTEKLEPEKPVRLSRILRLAVATLAVAAVSAVVSYFVAASHLASSIAGRPPVSRRPSENASGAARTATPPSIMLPTVAVSASPDQLQEEMGQVAAELRTQYPDLPEALHVAAMMHAQFRQTEEAEKLWRKCVELAPDKEQYRVNLAAVAMDRGNSELAAETLQDTLDAGMESEHVLYHLAVALTNLGRCEEAVEVSRRGLSLAPKSPALRQVLGEAQLKLGEAAEAESNLRTAIELGAQSGSIYFALANARARQGKHDEAAEARAKYAELTKEKPLEVQERFQILSTAEARSTAVTILMEAAAVHSWQSNSLEAERLLLRALALHPGSVASCQALAQLYYAAQMPAEERVVRRRLAEIEPHNFDHYLNLAKVSAQLGESEGAEAALKLSIAARPAAPEGYATLAEFYLESGQPSKARWFAQEAVRRAPTADGYELLASTCRLMGDSPGAEAAVALARQLDPKYSRRQEALSPRER
jgi:tetratricopeptide (TPR) repeat protein